MRLSSFKLLVGSVKLYKTAHRPFKVIQGHWFRYQSKAHIDFLLVSHRAFVLSFTVSEILHVFVLMTHPYSTLILGCSRWTRSPMLRYHPWVGTLSYSAIELFSKYSNVCDRRTWTSETDGQTIYCGITVLCCQALHIFHTVSSGVAYDLRAPGYI